MGICNYLIEGVSCAGKTSVATELERRGYHVVHGDRALAYKGHPDTGEKLDPASLGRCAVDVGFLHRHHLWSVPRVQELVRDRSHAVTFFCGGSRNFHQFIAHFDKVFVLDVDETTLRARLTQRPQDEFGGTVDEREFVLQRHRARDDIPPDAALIDATRGLDMVVDEILACTSCSRMNI